MGLALSLLTSMGVLAKTPSTTQSVLAFQDLPNEAMVTLHLIAKGGPFPYSKDGAVFGNRERLLPSQPRGYYREHTVKTVGARDRGARRIVCGGHKVTVPKACYYTDDHYASFRLIVK
jgi:ribonuclease T1